ncbi:MAG: glycosyltransferase [Lentisphaerae bacterium]|nr:glycosyltransferase [Lentisphaerota bacterium]
MKKIAVLLPCYNEELTIAKVVADFRKVLLDAEIYVYDNNSTDRSRELARKTGAVVRSVPQQGKGFVVRKMFQEIEADCYLMADSDDTYPAEAAPELIRDILAREMDMVTGDRLSTTYYEVNPRKFHNFGNSLVCFLIRLLFRHKVSDVMTGYRAFSRRFVKNCPILCSGFELETEMTLFALDRRLPFREIPVAYRDRPAGSVSKLNTYRDGFRVLKTIFLLLSNYRPMFFFGMLGLLSLLVSAGFFIPVLIEYLQTGAVPRYPTLFCAVSLAIIGVLLVACGLILKTVKHYFDCLAEINLKN